MKVVVLHTGRVVLSKGSRVKLDGLVYIVTAADTPTEIDDVTAHTEVEIQPAGPLPGVPTLPVRLLCRAG